MLKAEHDELNPNHDHETAASTFYRAQKCGFKPYLKKWVTPRPFRPLTDKCPGLVYAIGLTAFVSWKGQINAERFSEGRGLQRSLYFYLALTALNVLCSLLWVLITSSVLLCRQIYLELFWAQRGHDS